MSKFLRSIHDRHVKSMQKQVDWIDNHYWRWMLISIIPSVLLVVVFQQAGKRIDRNYAFDPFEPEDLKITLNPDRDPED